MGRSAEDQNRVRTDVQNGRMTTTALVLPPQIASGSNQPSSQAGVPSSQTSQSRKRKQPTASQDADEPPSATQIVAEEDVDHLDDVEVDEPDEVYVSYPTKVVGVRYYTVRGCFPSEFLSIETLS